MELTPTERVATSLLPVAATHKSEASFRHDILQLTQFISARDPAQVLEIAGRTEVDLAATRHRATGLVYKFGVARAHLVHAESGAGTCACAAGGEERVERLLHALEHGVGG